MEISNRSVGFLCVTAIVVAVIIRSGATTTVAAKSPDLETTSVTTESTHPSRVVNSDFGMINQQLPNTDDQVRQAKAPLVNNQDDATPPDDSVQSDDPLNDLYTGDQSGDASAPGIRERTNNTASWVNDEPLDKIGDLSDRELFDRWMSMMTDEERADFRVVWVAMTPEERQKYIDDMRGNTPGGG